MINHREVIELRRGGAASPFEAMRRLWPGLDDRQRVEIIRELSDAGMSGMQISHALGIPDDTIVAIRIRHNIVPAHGRRLYNRVGPEILAQISTMTDAGKCDYAIAEALGYKSKGWISKIRGRYRLRSPLRDLGLHMPTVLKIVDDFNSGATQREAAKNAGVHPTSVARLFYRNGWKWGRKNCGGRSGSKSSFQPRDEAIRADLKRLIEDEKLPPSEAAERLGLHRSRVSHLIREMNLTPAILRPPTSTRLATIIQMSASGATKREIATALGFSVDHVNRIARKHGIVLPDGRKR